MNTLPDKSPGAIHRHIFRLHPTVFFLGIVSLLTDVSSGMIFTLGNSSDFFVILREQDIQAPLIQVVAMLVLYNITHAAIALPMGILSDRMGRKRVIIIGWTVYALATSVWQV